MFKNRLLLVLFIAVPFVLVLAVTLFLGFRKYGSPAGYRQSQMELVQAREDSLRALELQTQAAAAESTVTPQAAAPAPQPSQADTRFIQAQFDSLDRVRKELEAREQALAAREELFQQNVSRFESENIQKLAALYDNMRTNLAVPIFISMDDTLAVGILSSMNDRTAAQLLGALAAVDIKKATRLNNLLVLEEASQ
jgi:flagellar motility protein MotE (MotC chaperone)